MGRLSSCEAYVHRKPYYYLGGTGVPSFVRKQGETDIRDTKKKKLKAVRDTQRKGKSKGRKRRKNEKHQYFVTKNASYYTVPHRCCRYP
jgi:hypothetical protein